MQTANALHVKWTAQETVLTKQYSKQHENRNQYQVHPNHCGLRKVDSFKNTRNGGLTHILPIPCWSNRRRNITDTGRTLLRLAMESKRTIRRNRRWFSVAHMHKIRSRPPTRSDDLPHAHHCPRDRAIPGTSTNGRTWAFVRRRHESAPSRNCIQHRHRVLYCLGRQPSACLTPRRALHHASRGRPENRQ